ncbi:ROK family protein [Tessaracoccus flavus]|uniref:Glucokinase n=1 Tax=Tessaracoccus flavus TaxID=1610493 RepID=A0A1Q2CHF2_9ACTN|nr:ROK family protein [Tessaracoccus flavus]AQP45503.1 glucokinase [Tessaracoccus flavus]SDY80717.1 glucokinase [Tessaracoccus flavus]
MSHVVGVDLGGTKTAAARVAPDGTLGEIVSAPTPALRGGQAVLDVVADLVRRVGGDDTVGLGVGTAGVVDATVGRIISATDTFSDWVGTDVAGGLRQRLSWSDRPIEVINDVDAHALGEQWLGAARDHGSVLMVAVGTGVGGAVVLDGRLWTGAHHVAGEIGHVPTPGAEGLYCACGRPGHLEAVAAGPAIERMYGVDGVDGRAIMARAEAGEEKALAVVERAASSLGRAIAGLVTVLDPACVVIGGGVALAGDVWWGPLRRTIRDELVPILADIPVLPAAAGPSAAILGAAKRALDSVAAHPHQRSLT